LPSTIPLDQSIAVQVPQSDEFMQIENTGGIPMVGVRLTRMRAPLRF
jgi:hypothetical protein